MNIWIVNHYAVTPEMSGGTRHYDIAKELVRRGHRVTIFASSFHYAALKEMKQYDSSPYLEEAIDGIEFVWVKTRPYRGNTLSRVINMFDFTWKVMCRSKPKSSEPDVIVGSSVHLFAVYAAYRTAKRLSVPFVMEVRDIWPQTLIDMGVSKWHPFVLLLGWLERFLYRKAQKIITLLPKADRHITRFGIEAQNIEWIPNGVNLESFIHPKPVRLLNSKKFNVLYTGTFGKANNLGVFVEAAVMMREYGDVHFTLVGSGPESEALEAAARDLDNVTVLTPVPKTDVAGLLASADVLYVGLKELPLYRFGMSMNKIFDYMAASKPIVFASSVVENPVEKAECGMVVPSEAREQIVHAILALYNMPLDKREQMGQMGYDYVSRHHSMDVITDRFENLLKRVVNE